MPDPTSDYGHELPDDDPILGMVRLPAAGADCRFVLRRAEGGRLMLQDRARSRLAPLQLDWSGPDMTRRLAAGRSQPLARACGLHRNPQAHILDATAGLGRDARCLAGLGARVTLYERHPALQALLRDVIDHQPEDLAGRLQLRCEDAHVARWPAADVIFLDPMFPSAGKRAAPARDMQYLQALLGPDEDAQGLLRRALDSGVRRVVLKRPPRGARVRLGEPQASFGGGRVVYDVYFPPGPTAAADP